MLFAHQLVVKVNGYSAEGEIVARRTFEGDDARDLAVAEMHLFLDSSVIAYAVMIDGQDRVIGSYGEVPLARLVDAQSGTRFMVRNREYTRRTGCLSTAGYYPGDERRGAGTARSRSESASIPAWNDQGQPCMLTLNATTKITFLED